MPNADERDAIDSTPFSTPPAIEMAVRSAEAQGLPTYVADAGVLRSVAILLARVLKQTPQAKDILADHRDIVADRTTAAMVTINRLDDGR